MQEIIAQYLEEWGVRGRFGIPHSLGSLGNLGPSEMQWKDSERKYFHIQRLNIFVILGRRDKEVGVVSSYRSIVLIMPRSGFLNFHMEQWP